MEEDASIDEFAATADDGGAGDDGSGDGRNDGEATDDRIDDDTDGIENATVAAEGEGDESITDTTERDADGETSPDLDDIAPMVTTYEWTPRDATCETCGEVTERRWRDGDAMVCHDCKDW